MLYLVSIKKKNYKIIKYVVIGDNDNDFDDKESSDKSKSCITVVVCTALIRNMESSMNVEIKQNKQWV